MCRSIIEALLEEKAGCDMSLIGSEAFDIIIRHHMQECGFSDDMEKYLIHLKKSSDIFEDLVEKIIVPETWFFRGIKSFNFLGPYLKSFWLPGGSNKVFRILSMPCSTGEEPYSIAMTLMDVGLDPKNFHIDAMDVNKKFLQIAKRAVYTKNSFRGDELGFRDRYFKKTDKGYQLLAKVRDKVHFKHGNMINNYFNIDKLPYDIIFCRNLLIYLNSVSRKQIIRNLSDLLVQNGLLFVGPSETTAISSETFLQLPHEMAFVFKKIIQAHSGPEIQRPIKLEMPKKIEKKGEPQLLKQPFATAHFQKEAQKSTKREKSSVTKKSLLDIAKTLADKGHLDKSASICIHFLKKNNPDAKAYFLLGIISNASGKEDLAEEYFNKAVYLNPNHYEALIYLALFKEQHGDLSGASLLYQRAQRAKTLL